MAYNLFQMLYFDTNCFRGTSDDRCWEFRRLADANNVLCFCPPRILIEISSHINNAEKDKFLNYQSYLRRTKILCSDYILPDYQQALATHLKTGIKFSDFSTDWNLYRDIIISSKNYADSLRQWRVYKNGGYYDLERTEDGIKEWRDRYESFWVEMFHRVRARGDVSKYLDTLEFKQLFLDTTIKSVGAEPIGEVSSSQIDEILEPIEAYFSAKKWIIREWFREQYSVKKHKNDFHDLTNLIYLRNERLFFITNETKLLKKIDESCKQRNRILTFAKAMERLQRAKISQ